MKFQEAIIELCLFLEIELTEIQVGIFGKYVSSKLTLDEFLKARDKYIETQLVNRYSNEKFAITLAKIIEIAKPQLKKEDEAQIAATNIISSIRMFGWPNSKDAEKHMGPLAWKVVEQLGGWTKLCEETKIQSQNILFAQLRETAKSVYQRSEQGKLNSKPELPNSTMTQLLEATKLKQVGNS